MILDSMLDDGKAKTGASGCFGMALVHPIEPLKDPILMFGRNADAGIADNQAVAFRMDYYTAAGDIVLNSIVAEITIPREQSSTATATNTVERKILLVIHFTHWQSLWTPVTENSTHSAILVQWSPMRSKYLAIISKSSAYSPCEGSAAMMSIMPFLTWVK